MRNKNKRTNKNFNSKYTTIISSFKPCLILFMIVIVATGPISALNLPVVDIASAQQEQQQQQISKDTANNESVTLENNKNIIKDNKKGVFHTLTSIPSSSESNDFSSSSSNNKTSNNTMHKIEMVVITLPTGQPAYKMISHVKSNGSSSSDIASSNNNNIDLTPKYSKLATIPGPALVFNEGDYVKVNIKDKDGNVITSEEFLASQPGTFLYI